MVGNWDRPGSVCMGWLFVMVLSSWVLAPELNGTTLAGFGAANSGGQGRRARLDVATFSPSGA